VDQGSTRRIEAITDGIFAIAMTLLVVDLGTPAQTPTTSVEALRHEAGPLAAFAVSFVVLAVSRTVRPSRSRVPATMTSPSPA
jgi:uncharacterized membrane protein